MIMIEKNFPIIEKLIFDALILAQQLFHQLNQEADTLNKTQHSEAIHVIASNKKKLVEELELFNKRLGQMLNAENLPHSQQGLTEYFQRAKAASLATAEVSQNWEAFKSIYADSKILNERNGASIEILSRHTKHSLQILKGKSQYAHTYGPDGVSKVVSINRTIDLA